MKGFKKHEKLRGRIPGNGHGDEGDRLSPERLPFLISSYP